MHEKMHRRDHPGAAPDIRGLGGDPSGGRGAIVRRDANAASAESNGRQRAAPSSASAAFCRSRVSRALFSFLLRPAYLLRAGAVRAVQLRLSSVAAAVVRADFYKTTHRSVMAGIGV